jgi:NAD+ kinase
MSEITNIAVQGEAPTKLRRVAVLYHPIRPQAREQAEWLRDELRSRGIATVVANGWNDEVVDHICDEQDLLVAFGGDGTIIRVARLAAPHHVPVLGVNMGRIGFLCELTPAIVHERVDALANGRFWLERRTMLQVECGTDREPRRYTALNEVTVARGSVPRAIRVRTYLDGDPFMLITADGILAATATGSTAYSLAAGGPVLYPESRDFMLTPVAPHLHIGRSVIVPGETEVSFRLESDRPAIMSVDGQDERPLHAGDAVTVRRSDEVVLFARMGPRTYFYTALADRLH